MVHVKLRCSLESIAKYCDCRDPRVSKGKAKVLFCQPQTQETKPVSLSCVGGFRTSAQRLHSSLCNFSGVGFF